MAYKFSETNKVNDEFTKVFGIGFKPFYDGLISVVTKQLWIDVLKFDEWLQKKHGNYEDEGKSMNDVIREHYGDKGVKLVDALTGADDEKGPKSDKREDNIKETNPQEIMEPKKVNERIAMAMLRQCALVWEHCISASMPYLDAKFCLADVKRGAYGKTTDRQKSKIGMIDVDVEHPKWEGAFRLGIGQIEGVTLSYDNYIKLTVESFSCGYWLDRVFEIAYDFCSSVGCPSLGNKMVFGWDNGERYAILPDVQQPKPKKSKSKAKVVKHQTSDIIACHTQTFRSEKPQTSIAEQLRQVLLAA